MPKIGCFWAFSHFFSFLGPFFENLEPKICFFIHQMLDEISQMTNICQKFTQNRTFKFYQKRNCPLSNARWVKDYESRPFLSTTLMMLLWRWCHYPINYSCRAESFYSWKAFCVATSLERGGNEKENGNFENEKYEDEHHNDENGYWYIHVNRN